MTESHRCVNTLIRTLSPVLKMHTGVCESVFEGESNSAAEARLAAESNVHMRSTRVGRYDEGETYSFNRTPVLQAGGGAIMAHKELQH